ncbi:hypothetical protein [Caballeronia sp. GAFFF1]|uniref:hypothetical protein n=1 Tax=Caballeronia sp. GAFFF1 TaxID=2921779 RepID=UPI002027A742|nr:hypothetical protein [Caballeronia sp. GAFFF1]
MALSLELFEPPDPPEPPEPPEPPDEPAIEMLTCVDEDELLDALAVPPASPH